MQVKIKRLHPTAVIPQYAKPGDAGMDLVATQVMIDDQLNFIKYNTGIAMEIPEGYVGLIYPRSSLSKKQSYLCNHVGVIDSGYRGEITCCFRNVTADKNYKPYEVGERIAQIIIMPYPNIQFVESDELSETERGDGGYGSTGK